MWEVHLWWRDPVAPSLRFLCSADYPHSGFHCWMKPLEYITSSRELVTVLMAMMPFHWPPNFTTAGNSAPGTKNR